MLNPKPWGLWYQETFALYIRKNFYLELIFASLERNSNAATRSSTPLHIFCKIQQSAFVLNNKRNIKINPFDFYPKIKRVNTIKISISSFTSTRITLKSSSRVLLRIQLRYSIIRLPVGPKTISFKKKALVTSNCVTLLLNPNENRLVSVYLIHPSET